MAERARTPVKNVFGRLTPEFEDYLIQLCFGVDAHVDPFATCLNTAYGDFCRTLRGISKVPDAKLLHENAVRHLTQAFATLQARLAAPMSIEGFDEWHSCTCQELIAVYKGRHTVYAGQAQKWVNMTLKYIYTLGEEWIPGFGQAFPFCHAPLDNVVLSELAQYDFPALTRPWSQIENAEYFDRQTWIRRKFVLAPLEVEFSLWLGSKVPVRDEQPLGRTI